MSVTLSYGYKKPVNGDKGSTFFPDLADDIQRLNDHSHNGTDSALLSPNVISKFSQTLLAAGWVSLGNGNYRQEATMPVGATFANSLMRFEISGGASDGFVIYPSIEKSAAGKYWIYINDNTLDVRVLYI